MNRPVLVTGAYGFIGRHVARALAAEGQTVIGLGHGVWSREQWRQWGIAEWHAADVTLDNLVTHGGLPGAVIHCAGSGTVGFSATHPHQDYQRTVETTAAVLEFVRLYAKEAAVVYPSSVAVYGHVGRQPIAETQPPNPVSPYGVHKQIAEQMCAAYARYFGIKAAIVRLFSVYGNGLRKQLLWDACSKLRRGESEFFGTGAELRDWLHAADAADLLALARRYASTECPVVNGGTGISVAVAEVVQEVVDAMHAGIPATFTGQTREVDPPSYVADVRRAAVWGWKARKPWREGVREYVEWFAAGEN